jgi:misacylated tRNA(Ala) deacylase
MKTNLLYHKNSFTYECTATVVAVKGDEIALDATVFYPGGGGQMADRGTISWDDQREQANVIAMNKRNDVVWHTVDCPPPAIGTLVVGTIDWDFRYQMMRTHTALHILCGIMWKEFGVQVTGGQMYPDHARMDFSMENLDRERIATIERWVNEAIAADYSIARRRSRFPIWCAPGLIYCRHRSKRCASSRSSDWTCRPMAARMSITRKRSVV